MKSWRIWLLTVSILFSYSVLVNNIYDLQIKRGGYYSARAASQSRGSDFLSPERGKIYFQDKNGNKIPAAINRDYPVVFAVPKEIKNPEEAAQALAPILEIDAAEIKNLLIKPNDLYELLLAKADGEQVAAINALGIKGIYIDNQKFRFYPFASLAAQLLGFVGPSEGDRSIEGRYGLESFYDNYLSSGGGKEADLVLTIDRDIQAQAEKVLKSVVDKYSAVGGTVIVQESKTGRILALGNFPNFDPNEYFKSPLKNFLNPALQSVYEPGSVFKIITMAAGIDSGKITPETTFYDIGSMTLNGKTFKNWDLKAHGTVTMTEVIEKSINTGAAFAEKKTGHDLFYNYLIKFGFDEPTGIGLPGEVSGKLKNLKNNFRDINFATAAFGQGVSVTPLQLINAVSAIANKGILMKPYLLDGEKPEALRTVISEESARQVTEMMVSAVKKAGVAQIPGYKIAGKTGTAQVPDFQRGGYAEEFIHSYVGFAPASDPRFTILIKVDKPRATLAGETVVPAFRELAQFILNYYNTPADNSGQK